MIWFLQNIKISKDQGFLIVVSQRRFIHLARMWNASKSTMPQRPVTHKPQRSFNSANQDTPLTGDDIIKQFHAAFGREGEKAFQKALHHKEALLCGKLLDVPEFQAHIAINTLAAIYALRALKNIDSPAHRALAQQSREEFYQLLDDHDVILKTDDGKPITRGDIEIAIALAIEAVRQSMLEGPSLPDAEI